MNDKINFRILLLLNIIQPADVNTLRTVYNKNNADSSDVDNTYIKQQLSLFLEKEYIVNVNGKNKKNLYSLSINSYDFWSTRIRHKRDTLRLLLLHNKYNAIMDKSCSGETVTSGETPLIRIRHNIQNLAEQFTSVRKFTNVNCRRASKKFSKNLGTDSPEQDILPQLRYYYSYDKQQILEQLSPMKKIGVMLGVSGSLISRMAQSQYQQKYYREYTIKKKSGGERKISAPRVFLKVVQRFIKDVLIQNLPVHNSVYSFQKNKNIIENATPHVGNDHMFTMDIEDFFGSITTKNIKNMLHEFYELDDMLNLIADLCTKDNVLPQGAPTSPILSNAYLYNFDSIIYNECKNKEITYTRYADDICISGNNKQNLLDMKNFISKKIQNYDLKLNKNKTRYMPYYRQQRVAGVVVNTEPSPSRYWVRKLRQRMYFAEKFGIDDESVYNTLKGRVAYLQSYPKYRDSDTIKEYRKILKKQGKKFK